MDEVQEAEKADVKNDGVEVKSDQESISTKEQEEESVIGEFVTSSGNKAESAVLVKMVEDTPSPLVITINTEDVQDSDENVNSACSVETEGISTNSLLDEHGYASINRDDHEKSLAVSNVISIPSNTLSSPSESVLDNVVYSDNISFVKEEIVLSEEIILENNEYNAYVNEQNIRNTNLSNEVASNHMETDMFFIGKLIFCEMVQQVW